MTFISNLIRAEVTYKIIYLRGLNVSMHFEGRIVSPIKNSSSKGSDQISFIHLFRIFPANYDSTGIATSFNNARCRMDGGHMPGYPLPKYCIMKVINYWPKMI